MTGFFTAPSRTAAMAVIYITVGILTMIWTGVWYLYVATHAEIADWQKFMCAGFFLSGFAVMVIGLLMGQIGSSAKIADNTIAAETAVPAVPGDSAAVSGTTTPVASPPAMKPTIPGTANGTGETTVVTHGSH